MPARGGAVSAAVACVGAAGTGVALGDSGVGVAAELQPDSRIVRNKRITVNDALIIN
jgi:hypothetical protein